MSQTRITFINRLSSKNISNGQDADEVDDICKLRVELAKLVKIS